MWGVSPSERAGKVISSTHIGVRPLSDWKAKPFSSLCIIFISLLLCNVDMWGVSPSERAGKVISSTHIGVRPLSDWKAKPFTSLCIIFISLLLCNVDMWGVSPSERDGKVMFYPHRRPAFVRLESKTLSFFLFFLPLYPNAL
jgi:hypothetical protein